MRRFKSIFTSFMLIFAFSIAVAPSDTASANNTTTFKQEILKPDCYDLVVTSEGGTIDYIATFDCTYRMPDGTAFTPAFVQDNPLSLQ